MDNALKLSDPDVGDVDIVDAGKGHCAIIDTGGKPFIVLTAEDVILLGKSMRIGVDFMDKEYPIGVIDKSSSSFYTMEQAHLISLCEKMGLKLATDHVESNNG